MNLKLTIQISHSSLAVFSMSFILRVALGVCHMWWLHTVELILQLMILRVALTLSVCHKWWLHTHHTTDDSKSSTDPQCLP